MINIVRIDHFVMPCSDVEEIADFYVKALGVEKIVFDGGRLAIRLGGQKLNLQPAGGYSGLHAPKHLPGTQDFCLVSDTPVADVKRHLEANGITVIEGPVPRTGAAGQLSSVYFRDPDGNLVEISNYV
tara:strand:+ start:1215 stop:1598 length:384 start_codon:yes stop_codon:yes gene_type:complete